MAYTKNSRASNSKRTTDDNVPYKCTRCGKTTDDPKGKFFMSKTSPLYVSNELYSCICCECANELYNEAKIRFKDEKLALIILCHYLDVYFSDALYDSIKVNADFSFGNYAKLLNGTQYKAKNFTTYLVDVYNNGLRSNEELKEQREAVWSATDKQNMNFVLSTVGYDPFDSDRLTESDRKYCFNVLSGYCDTEGIKDDGHKLLSCIEITNALLQVKKLNDEINSIFQSTSVDEAKIQKLTAAKKSLSDTVASMAKDNNIASAYNGRSKQGINTLTSKMKEMEKEGFEGIKVNLFDIKTSEAMKQIADLSNKSIMEQLTFDSNEYTEMIKEQRDMIEKFRSEKEKLNEENRLLKNKISDYEFSLKKNV